jgi:HK97 family phage major capsid protein
MDAIQLMTKRIEELSTLLTATEAARAAASTKSESEKSALEARIAQIETGIKDLSERKMQAERLSLPGVEVAANENDRVGKAFSFGRMAKLCMNPRSGLEDKELGYEAEVYRNMKKAYGGLDATVKAELNASTGEGGAFLIPSEVQATMIPLLREQSIIRGLGATILPGLVGNVIFNRQATDVTAYHINTEATDPITTSAPKFERLELRPHVLACLVPMTWEMRTQSAGSLEQFVRDAIIQQIALAQDLKAFTGTGVGSEPRGILNHPDVQSQSWSGVVFSGTNQTVTDTALEMYKKVRKSLAARGSLGWACSPDALVKLAKSKDADGKPLFTGPGSLLPSSLVRPEYAIRESQQLDDAVDTNENLVFGNYADAVIGEWGTMAFAMSETSGTDFETMRARLRGAIAWDFAMWRGVSFVKATALAG